MTRTHGYISFLLLIILPLTACGYHNPYLAGPTNGERLAIHLPLWENRTSEPGLEAIFRDRLADRLHASPAISLTNEAGEAAYILSGQLQTIRLTSNKGTLRLTVNYQLLRRSDNRIVWREEGRTFSRQYSVNDDPLFTRDNRRRALAEIADQTAEKIANHLLVTLTELQEKQR